MNARLQFFKGEHVSDLVGKSVISFINRVALSTFFTVA